ncbi:carbon-nitrogen hydrolase family protein [Stieleria sp. TO1_6]|nr:carbon-nitrogen hydrolase family protein [Stieleria tagensis]
MLIACVQSDVTFADPAANLNRVLAWMETAAEKKKDCATEEADVVVFPECMLTGYAFGSRQHALEVALEIDDPIFQKLGQAARQWGQFVTLGFLESAAGRLYNSAVLIGPDGVVGCYRKIHLPHLGVDRFVDRGDQPYQTFAAATPRRGRAQIGLAICYDASFPEPIRVLGLAGADIIALGTNWPVEAARTAQIVPSARSLENHLYFAAANRVGHENGFDFCGLSSICGPDGVVLAATDGDQETMLLAEIDLAVARNKRIERTAGTHIIDRFADRRPEFYGSITEG